MPDFQLIREYCKHCNALNSQTVDNFLIYYTAEREKLEPKMNARIKKIKHVTKEWPPAYLNFFKSEFIAHKIFQKGGYIHKYLQRREVKQKMSPEEHQYLELLAKTPWCYSFSEISAQPEKGFFEMEDILTGENYLLFSPGMQKSLAEMNPKIWLILRGFNGKCWETFGMIAPIVASSVDDLFFFATEMNPFIDDEEMLMEQVDKDPFPYFMLMENSTIPATVSQGFEVVMCNASDPLDQFSAEPLQETCRIDWNEGICQMKLKDYGSFPHFANAYYDERKRRIMRTAMTTHGFDLLSKALMQAGFPLEEEAEICVSIAMHATTEKILKKRINLFPYEKYFSAPMPSDFGSD